jgi:hypothetical protein
VREEALLMKWRGILVLALIAVFAVSAHGQKIPNDTGDPVIPIQGCDTTGWKPHIVYGPWIFDCMVNPPIPIEVPDDGDVIQDVIFEIDIFQTWCGDLKMEIWYDYECDGQYELGPVAALCRPQLDGCPDDGCCGCSGDVRGVYQFGDDGTTPLGEFDCPTIIPIGCYTPAIESLNPFEVFKGAPKGGCFWVRAVDGACADGTELYSVAVWTDNVPPTPTQDTTWGQIKALYE